MPSGRLYSEGEGRVCVIRECRFRARISKTPIYETFLWETTKYEMTERRMYMTSYIRRFLCVGTAVH